MTTLDPSPPAERRLLSFYDRLRRRMAARLDSRSETTPSPVLDALLLVPDVFILLVRLSLDHRVPARARALIGGALAYFLLPIDLLPEAFVGPGGFVDDLVLALAVVAQAFGAELEPFTEKYWSGRMSLRQTLSDVLGTSDVLLRTDLYARLKRYLAARGIDLEKARTQA